jgi:hypothetical protein
MASKTPKKNPAEKFMDLVDAGKIKVPLGGFPRRSPRPIRFIEPCLDPVMQFKPSPWNV